MDKGTATLDLVGLVCPHVSIKVKSRLSTAAEGELLEVHADDPMAVYDVPLMVTEHGHSVVSVKELGSKIRIVIRAGRGHPEADLWPFDRD